ncbi:MAG: hypothetical protein AB7O38_30840 [Pirellulaceae bacterium]
MRRWWYLFPERRDDLGLPAEPTALEIRSLVEDRKRVAELRKRLSSISWFMKALNEWFAKRANACEDQAGHFWAERFGCRNLVDEGALLLCSIYIDLNEIRAELASRPEDSRYTSAYTRILARVLRRAREESERQPPSPPTPPPPPCPSPPTPTDYRPGDPDYWMCLLSTDDLRRPARTLRSRRCRGTARQCNGPARRPKRPGSRWRRTARSGARHRSQRQQWRRRLARRDGRGARQFE